MMTVESMPMPQQATVVGMPVAVVGDMHLVVVGMVEENKHPVLVVQVGTSSLVLVLVEQVYKQVEAEAEADQDTCLVVGIEAVLVAGIGAALVVGMHRTSVELVVVVGLGTLQPSASELQLV